MNQMQQMLMQAQKMQRELVKAHQELDAKEFVVKKAGIVTVTLKGDKTIVSIAIEKDALTPDNVEMIQDTLTLAINEGLGQIQAESDAIEERLTGQKGALPF
jgi:nucleoid-associated protein EbfC